MKIPYILDPGSCMGHPNPSKHLIDQIALPLQPCFPLQIPYIYLQKQLFQSFLQYPVWTGYPLGALPYSQSEVHAYPILPGVLG